MKEDLFAEFPHVSSSEWHEKILKDLKGRSLIDQSWSPDGELRMSPYVHADDVPFRIQGLERFGTWKIGESFTVTDEIECNKQLLESLQGGTEAIRLKCDAAVNWERLLQGIELSIIHLGIEAPLKEVDGFLSYASGRYSLDELHLTLYSSSNEYQSIRYCNIPVQTDAIVDGLVSVIVDAVDKNAGNYAQCSSQDLSTVIGMHYLVEIARLRALRILWKNLSTAMGFEMPSSFAIEAHLSQESVNDNPEQQMIRNTVKTLAAVLGGADRIYFENAVGSGQQGSSLQRISRNIHHLLRYESKMTEMEDPMAGAYYIDKLTQEIVHKTWEMLLQTMRKEDE